MPTSTRGQMLFTLSLALVSFTGVTDAFWRLPCRGRSGLGMIDPIVDPGVVSGHTHTIHGDFGLNATSSGLQNSTCSACQVKQDMSAYWTPPLYFMYPNGTAVMLEQVGGMLAYYLLYGDNVTAFPQGFELIAGDPFRRNFTCAVPEPPKSDWSGYEISQPALAQKAIGFNCLNYAVAPEPSLGRHFLPNKTFIDNSCPDGLRLELFFPSCWNGKDATAPDHHSHMAYPSIITGGDCPAGYPARTPSLFFETIWNTAPFKGVDGQFVISTGDPTGYSYHGDFMEGWQSGFLQQAVDTCTNPSGEVTDCPIFDLETQDQMSSCSFPQPTQLAGEDPAGPCQGLPGNNPIQSGPQAATVAKATPTHSFESLKSSSSVPTTTSASVHTSQPPQPTLAATSVTDSAGGGAVFADAISTSSFSAVSPEKSKAVKTADASSAPEDSITEAPPAKATASPSYASTVLSTSGQDVWEIFVVDELVTVTAEGPAPSPAANRKRHDHAHRHHHADHGGHF